MSFISFLQQGGTIVYVLLILNVIGVALILWRAMAIREFKKNIGDFYSASLEKFKKMKLNKEEQSSIVIVKDTIADEMNKLEIGLPTIKIIATISPLLGLLGTVWGILTSFRIISEAGLNNPALFAGGISTALITTVAGLIVAIIHYIAYHYLTGAVDGLELEVEKNIIPKLFGAQ